MVALLATMGLNLKQLLSTSAQRYSTLTLSTKVSTEAGRILGPFDSPPLPNLQCSGLGAIPKHDGGSQMIRISLICIIESNINDFIDINTYTVSYCTVDDAYTTTNKLGQGALFSKIHLKNAFRLIPVQQEDWNLLDIYWKSKYYKDTRLPFGLRSAPLFNQLADAIHWMLQNNYEIHHLLHYLYDFLTAGPADSNICNHNLTAMKSLCQAIGAPIKDEKVEGPTTRLTILGIVLDTVSMEASFSVKRKTPLLTAVHSFHTFKKCTKRLFLSLIGILSFACKVVPAGRIFEGSETKAMLLPGHLGIPGIG